MSNVISEDKKSFTDNVTGTISWGTLRPQDLLPAFMDIIALFVKEGGELDSSDEWNQLVKEVKEKLVIKINTKDEFVDDDHKEWNSEFTSFVINEDLWDILCSIAPKGYEFGTTEGDGADFGFWSFCEKENSFDEDDCLECPHKDTSSCPEK